MEDVKINISSVGFPSQFVSDSEKATKEFGLQIGQAIQYEWFRKDSNGLKLKHMPKTHYLKLKEASIKI